MLDSGPGAMVWIRLGRSKLHLVIWKQHNSVQRTFCGKFLEASLGAQFKLWQTSDNDYCQSCQTASNPAFHPAKRI